MIQAAILKTTPIADMRLARQNKVMTTIYVALVNEGTDAWRPVKATSLSNDTYRVEGAMDEDEEWEFSPGTTVRCEWMVFGNGEHGLAAIDVAD